MKTAVLFLIFNRPDTTARVFEAIRNARPERLYVAADGPREGRQGEAEQCRATRGIATAVDWECELHILFRDRNLGCKEAVSSAITWFFEQEEEGIILEDDCLPHPDFFPFCEKLLEKYRDDERVMMIGGTNYLLDKLNIPESYCFSRYFAIWGWATWRRAWAKYDITMEAWPRRKAEGALHSYYRQRFMRRHVSSAFDGAYSHRINTWDTQWFYSCLFNNGLSIIPRVNMISNIGITGSHSSQSSVNHFLPVQGMDTGHMVHQERVHPDITYDDTFFMKQFKPDLQGLLGKVSAFIRKRIARPC